MDAYETVRNALYTQADESTCKMAAAAQRLAELSFDCTQEELDGFEKLAQEARDDLAACWAFEGATKRAGLQRGLSQEGGQR